MCGSRLSNVASQCPIYVLDCFFSKSFPAAAAIQCEVCRRLRGRRRGPTQIKDINHPKRKLLHEASYWEMVWTLLLSPLGLRRRFSQAVPSRKLPRSSKKVFESSPRLSKNALQGAPQSFFGNFPGLPRSSAGHFQWKMQFANFATSCSCQNETLIFQARANPCWSRLAPS